MVTKFKFEKEAHPIITEIDEHIERKASYLEAIKQALATHDDQQIYRLLDEKKFATEILQKDDVDNDPELITLTTDIREQLSSYLSLQLIDYLGQQFPFFYYEEYQEGHFRLYFGNWWDRRNFGELDVLNLRFVFNTDEYHKLATTVKLSSENRQLNTEKIEKIAQENNELDELVTNQENRAEQKINLSDQIRKLENKGKGLFHSKHDSQQKQVLIDQLDQLDQEDQLALTAGDQIQENKDHILALTKEDTLLAYEMKSVLNAFGSFATFEARCAQLYPDYLRFLSQERAGKRK